MKSAPIAKRVSKAKLAELRAKLSKIVPAHFQAERAFLAAAKVGSEETFESTYGAPCSDEELDALEKALRRPLPPSYRAFLSLYGRHGKRGMSHVLGPREHRSSEIKSELRDRSGLFDDAGEDDPIAAGALPLFVSGRKMVLMVPPVRADGEMDVVDYDLTEEMSRARDVAAYFAAERAKLLRMSKKGGRKAPASKRAPKKAAPVAKTAPTGRIPSAKTVIDAMRAGKGGPLIAAFGGAGERADLARVVGGAADARRWDVRIGRALLEAQGALLGRPLAECERFLATLSIAAARESGYDAAKKRESAAAAIAALAPLVARSLNAADMVARSGCHALNTGLGDEKMARVLFELARGCKAIAKNEYFVELRVRIGS